MRGNDPFSRSPSRHRSTFFDDDDDGEPFEQDPPPGLFQKSAHAPTTPDTINGGDSAHSAPDAINRRDGVPSATEAIHRREGVPSTADTIDRRDSAPEDASSRSSERRSSRYGRRAQDLRATHLADGEFSDVRRAPPSVSAPSKPARSLRGRALGYLSRREHSRDELARKLASFVEETDAENAVSAVLNRLEEEGWLSDTRFAESVVNRRASRFGASRIVGELKRHRVDSDTIQVLSEDLRDSEWERIRAVWTRKFGVLAQTPQERAKQARFLASRGFSRDAIMRIIKAGDDEMLGDE